LCYYASAILGSYRARGRLDRFTWVWNCVYYILLLCLSRVERFNELVRCTIVATLFLLHFYFGKLYWYFTGK